MPKTPEKFSIKARISSFAFAWAGITAFFKTGHNARIHLLVACLVLATTGFLKVSCIETIAVILAIALVWITEMVNTVIEKIMDFISEERLPQIQMIKDIAAGAVLIAAITALAIGCIIFLPRIF
ncbi:MAG: diacylglycerol kinase [Flavisolibacter sp.]